MKISFTKPDVMTNDQWKLTKKFMVLRLLSVFTYTFAPTFFFLYVMQHMSMQIKSAHNLTVTVMGAITYAIIANQKVMTHIHKWVMPLSIVGTGLGVFLDLLIVTHPIITVFVSAIFGHVLNVFVKKGFAKILNRAYAGDAKTAYSNILDLADGVGLCLASVCCWICADVPLEYIVFVDIVLMFVDLVFTYKRYIAVQMYLEKHPYHESSTADESNN